MMIEKSEVGILEKLVELPGVPGREGQVADFIRSSLPSICDCRIDHLGNLIVHVGGKGKRVMLVAHMDEVGFIVQRILDNGFLKIERMGGTSIRALPGSRLSLWTSKGCLPAVAGVLPQHLDSKEFISDFSRVFIDVGTFSKEETLALGVSPGDVLTWNSPLKTLGKSLVCGKALDDRLGCYCLMQLARNVKPEELACDLYLTFSVQEESILIGSVAAINAVEPEVLIGVDGTFAFDTPDLQGQQSDIRLGSGPAVKWMDAIRGKLAAFVPNQALTNLVCETAQKRNIPLQDEISIGMSTAATSVIYVKNGARACAISIPIRYHHTPVEMADLRDIENTIALLRGLLTIDL
ncbi:MAG: M42 family metallopeptidase [Chloroflexi bacterium]|nr:M42 family metallopeptidase [Chloroflexota bacterium]